MSRIADVGNPWLDAGIVAFSTMKYNTDRAYWDKWFPADFITESFPGQFRNWFYALLSMSTMMSDGKPPFKTLLGHGLVKDQFGHEMHKTSGNSIEFISAADAGGEITDPKGKPLPFGAIGADVMRWLYCRANPAANLNFGPEPANEVRSKVFFKLWNTYAMFCNYATGDGFDPAAPPVPVGARQDVDHWLQSKLQHVIMSAELYYSKYSVMQFALECEKFIENDLSNWYVRRNKDRLHSKAVHLDACALQDKWSAYQTIYTTLKTLCKLMAPCVPFVTEVMWQNLKLPSDPESVHLCDFPLVDEELLQDDRNGLTLDMQQAREVISLGLAARQVAKLSVRQPLGELVIWTTADVNRKAVERFRELILDELNIKAVRFADPTAGRLLTPTARLNKKTAASKLGGKLAEAEQALSKMDEVTLNKFMQGSVEVCGVLLTSEDVIREYNAPAGYAPAPYVVDPEVIISTTITEPLKLEGLARDVVRQVQSARKDAKLDLLDKIALHLSATSPELAKAIGTHRDTIATAVQATRWSESALVGDGVHTATVKIDGQPLTIALRKV